MSYDKCPTCGEFYSVGDINMHLQTKHGITVATQIPSKKGTSLLGRLLNRQIAVRMPLRQWITIGLLVMFLGILIGWTIR